MSLKDKLKGIKLPKPSPRSPLWKGPEVDGITYSMLSRWLCCRERFRVRCIEGLRPTETFNHKIEYGQMWHVCEEWLARGGEDWADALDQYADTLRKRYPLFQEQIVHWANVCRVQFPLYINHWARQPDVANRSPIVQEQVFDIPYDLPSGRKVRLRGKWDSVDLVHDLTVPKPALAIYLQENKTKGDIRQEQIQRQLRFDLQTMMYMVTLTQDTGIPYLENVKQQAGRGKTLHDKSRSSVKGVRYNVIRRPLSGGSGTIRQHKPSKGNPRGESSDEFYGRVRGIIADAPQDYFMRWDVAITPGDVDAFRRQCLDPILEQLCDWYEWVRTVAHVSRSPFESHCANGARGIIGDPKGGHSMMCGIHYRHPYGVYNALDEGGSTDLDEYLDTGSTVGLERVDRLFNELE